MNHKKKTVLVTGGAGYIGSIVVDQLIRADYSVVVYDNLSRGHKDAVHPKASLIIGDIADKKLLKKSLLDHKINAVMHFAAYIEAGESMKKPEVYFRNNTINTLILLETLIENNVKKLVFSSTAAVYGNPEKTPITEESPLKPTNAYGASKLLVEQTLAWYHQIHGLSYAALRYFNACGAIKNLGENHQPESHLIPLALDAATGNRPPLSLYGIDYPTLDGTCIRDYIHVSDLARAHLLSLEKLYSNKPERLIYNLGSEKGFSNREVIETVGKVVGKPVLYKETERRPGDPAILIASSEKIKSELGWEAKYKNIEDVIQSAYTWRLKYPKGYSS